MTLTKSEFHLVFDEMRDSTRTYYYNKFHWSHKKSCLGMIFPSKDIYRNHLEGGRGAVETLLEYNRNQGRHVDFKEAWVRSDDNTDTLLETSNSSKELMDPQIVDEMYEWIIGDPDLLYEWKTLHASLKKEDE